MTVANSLPDDDPPDFFVSRAGADAAIAIAVADALIEAGYRVLIQDKDFANKNFMDAMDRGLASSGRVIAILSEDYFRSDHCRVEWEHPLIDDPLNRHARLIAMKARECAPRGLLKAIAYWDLVRVRETPELLKAMVMAAVDPAHRLTPQLAGHWRQPATIRHDQIRATPGFTGRGEELADIDGALWALETPALTQSAAVQGFGGVGKSTIAREYAWRVSQLEDVYAGVWWLDAETQGAAGQEVWPGIEQGYIALGDTFIRGLAERQDRHEAARIGRNFIERAGFEKPWLIVYDNVDHVATLAAWPPPDGAHVIVTTRMDLKAKGVTRVEIASWPPADAIQYLLENSGRPDMTDGEAEAIAEALGCLPLALTHAAAYLSDNDNATVASYLGSLTHHMRDVPESALVIAPSAVFATLQHNIAQAEARAPGAAAVLQLAAFYAADAIPEELFRQAAEHYPEALAQLGGEGPALEKAIGALGRLGLTVIDREARTFSIHRLVQAAARDTLGDAAALWSSAAVAAADAAFPRTEFENWAGCERLLPHALAAIATCDSDMDTALATLCGNSAFYLHDRAEYALAELLYQRSLAIREKALGPEHLDVSRSLNNLALLYNDQGHYDRAEPLFQRALDIRERALGPDHPHVGTSLNNLAALYYAQGEYDLAVPLLKRDFAITEKVLGPDHPDVGQSLNNLALLYHAQGKYDLAEPLFQRGLNITEKALGEDHPHVGTSLNNLALLYHAQGKYDLAEPLFQRGLNITEKALGPEHPDVGLSLNNLAGLHHAQGHHDRAEPLFQRAIAIREKALGPDHPDVGQTLNNLAELYRTQGHYDRAEPLYQRALDIREKALGPDHPDVGTSLNNLAELYRTQGHYDRAEPLYQRALDIREKALGPDHPDVGTSLNNLAELYRAQGHYDRAEPLFQRALEVREKALGPDHPDVGQSLNNLAALYQAQGHYDRAEPLFERALGIWEKALGPDHPLVGNSLNNLAGLHHAQGHHDRAEPLFQRALDIWETALGPAHQDTALACWNLADLFVRTGRLAEAARLARRAVTAFEAALGSEHPHTIGATQLLAAIEAARDGQDR